MTKFKLNGKSMLMVLSLFVFMALGSVSATAQNWVTPDEAVLILKDKLTDLESEYNQAQTTQEKLDVAFETRYFNVVFYQVTDGGMEVPQAVSTSKPVNKPMAHTSGLVYFDASAPNFKMEAQALVDTATDLLSN